MLNGKNGSAMINKALGSLVNTKTALAKGIELVQNERSMIRAQIQKLNNQIPNLDVAEGQAHECIDNINALLPKKLK